MESSHHPKRIKDEEFNSFRVGEDFVVCHRFHLRLFILKPFGLRDERNGMTEKNMSINPTFDLNKISTTSW
jgi:hypothetical protein